MKLQLQYNIVFSAGHSKFEKTASTRIDVTGEFGTEILASVQRLQRRTLEGDGVHRAEKRELLLELVRLDDRHQLRARHRALQLLAVQELGLDLLPLALPAGPRESLGAPEKEDRGPGDLRTTAHYEHVYLRSGKR